MNTKDWILLGIKFIFGFIVMLGIFFGIAGTWNWIEGWVFLIIHFTWATFLTIWLSKHSPELLKKRSSFDIPDKWWDKIIMMGIAITMTAAFVMPSLGIKYGWPRLPLILEPIGFIGVIIAMIGISFVFKENSHAALTVKIQKNQKVISTGPYKYVRHPLYSWFVVLMLSVPLAFGIYYAFIPAILGCIVMIIRTPLEEKVLLKDLKGYKEYTKKTKYRILPRVW
ncbi:methyltransferase family protein [Nanoarchaeota archaeon]